MKLYLVGGAVRDHLLGMPSRSDLDFAVEADSFEAMKDALLARGLTLWQERPEYVTLRGRLPAAAVDNFGGFLRRSHDGTVPADFTLCRAETSYSDHRHPDTVTPAPLAVDLSRRDFTMNAVAVSETGQVVDLFNGMRDVRAGILKTVGNAVDRFDEDPLRLLRALRFRVKYNLVLHNELWHAVARRMVCEKVKTLPHERVREELGKAFAADWLFAAQALSTDFATLGYMVQLHFPNLWLKATTEAR